MQGNKTRPRTARSALLGIGLLLAVVTAALLQQLYRPPAPGFPTGEGSHADEELVRQQRTLLDRQTWPSKTYQPPAARSGVTTKPTPPSARELAPEPASVDGAARSWSNSDSWHQRRPEDEIDWSKVPKVPIENSGWFE